jgi:hypothetical protein
MLAARMFQPVKLYSTAFMSDAVPKEFRGAQGPPEDSPDEAQG